MSVGCSTTHSKSAVRVVSEQMSQISSMVKNPQRGQGRTVSRVALMARAILSGCWPRDWTIQSAMRSAERGPIPGICRNWAINSRIAEGYSVFLKTGASLLRCAAQLQGQGLEPAKIQLQRPVLFSLGTARALKLRIGFGPAFLAVKDNAVPKGVAPRDDLPRSIQSQRDRLVNFVPLADINSAEKVDRPGHEDLAGELERARPEQDARAVKAIGDAEAARQFHRFACGQQAVLPVVFHRRHDHAPGADAGVDAGVPKRLDLARLVGLSK